MNNKHIILVFSIILISSNLIAQEQKEEKVRQPLYGQKGIIELFGSLSLQGSSGDFSRISFSAQPGLNYFITDNFYMGPRLNVEVTRRKIGRQYYQYTIGEYYNTTVNLGLGIPLGFIFKVNDHVYFNLESPELSFYLNDLHHFVLYPNLITAMKFPFDNSVVTVGLKHNFFNIADTGVSNLYYSYNVFLGFSAFFDTVKKRDPAGTDNRDVSAKSVEPLPTISPALVRGKIAGAFFMSWLPVCSGSWLAGWDWGGFAFAFLKTVGAGCIVAAIFSSGVPPWVIWTGVLAWPIMTVADMVYSPCMVAYHYKDVLKNNDNSGKPKNGQARIQIPEVMVNAAPRLSFSQNKINTNQTQFKYKVDGINVLVSHAL